jgi:curved DNA-binding protein CbpA
LFVRRKLQRVTDYFALLQETRRPWLDPDKLKEKFLALSAQVHPDRTHESEAAEKERAQSRFTDLNAAYTCLSEPKSRLAHLLELELGAKSTPVQSVPPHLMDLFMEISASLRAADALQAEKNAVSTSPLLKAQVFGRSHAVLDQLAAIEGRINEWREKLLAKLKTLDAEWLGNNDATAARDDLLKRLEDLRHLFSYLARWGSQVREKSFQLTL